MRPTAFLPSLLLAAFAASQPAAATSLYGECSQAIAQLRGNGVVKGLSVHGSNPRGFDLLVNEGKWQLIDPGTRNTIVHLAACYAAQGDGSLQISGIVHDALTNRELGAMGLSGEYFPHVTGPGQNR